MKQFQLVLVVESFALYSDGMFCDAGLSSRVHAGRDAFPYIHIGLWC